jgi:hypothetical protein
VADADHQADHANQHVPLVLFARPVPKHSGNSTKKKKRLLSAGFERGKVVHGACCRNGMRFHHHQSTNNFALTMNGRWQNFYDIVLRQS